MSRLSFVLAIALVSTASAGVASARPADDQVKLSVRGVDLANPHEAKAFYDHIQVAARAACNSDTITPGGLREDRECREQFVSDAVNQINAPLLTALNSRDSRQAPTAYAFGDQ